MNQRSAIVGKRLSVLVVDDDPAMQDSVAAVLGDDVDVVTCGSASEAMHLSRRSTFDVVCSDYEMPVMNGLDLLNELAKGDPSTGLLLLTGSTDYFAQTNAGQYYVLIKPFDPARLIALVIKLGQGARAKRGSFPAGHLGRGGGRS
jgi:DNA-binding NtrC family response regulator